MKNHTNDFKNFLAEERRVGLVDVKFCVANVASSDTSVDQAAAIVLSAIEAYKAGNTKSFIDY